MTGTELFGKAKWVSAGSECDNPYIRGIFEAKDITSAEITVCGLGFFELFLNGRKVSGDLFVPALSDFHDRGEIYFEPVKLTLKEQFGHRIYCLKYDITDYIQEGKNSIGVMLSQGWYGNRLWISPRYGDSKLCFKITLNGKGGERCIYSDKSLKWKQSYILESDIYSGEKHDYSLYLDHWCETDFDDSDWANITEIPAPDSEFYIQTCPADKVIRHIKPKLVYRFDDVSIYDVGQNITGYPVIFCDSTKREKITVRMAEELMPDGTIDETRHYGQKCEFMTDGAPRYCHTRFTWHGFRYFEVTNNATATDAVLIHCDIEETSDFSCDNELLNWLYKTYVITQKENMHCGIPSDCPHIERRGYSGDGQLTCDAVMTMFDAKSFYDKWIDDISDCQDRISGHVQYTAPYAFCGGGPGGWGCAIVVVPYMYYKHYGDKDVLSKMYPQMLRYFDYLEAHSENNFVTSDEPGRWCLGDWAFPNKEEVLIPEPFVNNYFYILSMKIVMEIADIIGRTDFKKTLDERIHLREKALIDHYFDDKTGNFCDNRQGANAFAIDLGLGDERTLKNLAEHYKNLGMYDTGIFGTDILTRIFFEKGYSDLAFSLLTSEKEISFHTMKQNGATTLWEHWKGTRSHNHPMFGAVVRYLFQYILGIRQVPGGTGFEKVTIAPKLVDGLNSAQGKMKTVSGEISVCYNKLDDMISFDIFIGGNIEAVFCLGKKSYPLKKGKNNLIVCNI